MKNNNQINVLGKQEFVGKQIPIIEGGFGEGKRCLTDKVIAEIHNQAPRKVRETINNNIKRFKVDIDLIDIKRVLDTDTLRNLDYAKQSITQSEHIYLLSERGYAKLIKIMDSDLAWEIHDKLIDEYFTMRNIINNQTIDMEYINALVPNIIQNTLQGTMLMINKNNEIIDKKINDTLDYAKNIITQQEIKHEEQLSRTIDLIGFKTSNTSSLSKLLKSKLADIKGYDVKASDYHYMSAKERIFRRMNVFKWEDIPVNRYNDVHAMIDSIDCLEAIEEI